jgi:RNA polymerase sigma factor (sigma-70 family)
MTIQQGNRVLHHLQRLVAGSTAGLPDTDLLECYLQGRDESAFRVLVQRHGPTVLGVCRAVLGHAHDAEDAFQATFLVLARKAGSILRRDGLGSWLHGVAHRVALKARVAAARRRAVEARVAPPAPASPGDDLSWGEVRALLHAELAALPVCFREPLLLCYLQGLTQEEAARRLGWTAATVKGRLQRGRHLLRRRLEKRGLGLAALGAAALTGQGLVAAVPPALVRATVQAALPATGATTTAAALAALLPGRWRLLAALPILAAVLAGGFALFPQSEGESAPPAVTPAQPAPEVVGARADHHGDPLPEGAVARLGTVRFNHGDGLNALFFTPDGKTIVSEGNGSLRLWEAGTGKERKRCATAKPSFDDQTALTPNGRTLVRLNQENEADTLRFFDLAAGKEVRTVPLPLRRLEIATYRRNALSPDGRLCAIHAQESVRVFDTATAKELYRLPFAGGAVRFPEHDKARGVAFAGPNLLVTSDNQQPVLQVWEARTGKAVRQFAPGGPVQVLTGSPDGRLVAALAHHNYAIDRFLERDLVRVWDLNTGKLKHTLPARPKGWHMDLRFGPDGKRLLVSTVHPEGMMLTVWDAETGEKVRELAGAGGGRALAFSPDGSRLALGGQGKFDLWDLKTGRPLGDQDSRQVLAAATFLSPAGDRAWTVGYKALSAWDVATGRRLHSGNLPPYTVTDPRRRFSPDGRYVVTYEGDFQRLRLLLWDVRAGRLLHTLRPEGATSGLQTAFAPDSSLLAAWLPGKQTTVRFWEVRTGRPVRSFAETKAGWPGLLYFSPDGRTLIVAGRRVVGYDAATGKELFSWRMEPRPDPSGVKEIAVGAAPSYGDDRIAWHTLVVSPDGELAACILGGGDDFRTRVDNRVVLCEARTGKVLRAWNDSGLRGRWWEQLCFSPDGRLLASSDGSAVHVWEAASGSEVRTFRAHEGEIESLAFSGNGRRLISAASDSTALIWDLPLAVHSRRNVGPVDACWEDLARPDAARAWAAVWRLAAEPEASVPFLRKHLRPVGEAEMAALRRHVTDLGSDTFAVRQKAFQELKRLGPEAAPALRSAAEEKISLETRRRIDQLLDQLRHKPPAAAWLRTWRALAVLEQAGTPAARRLLQELARGASGAWLTEQARAAQQRLRGRA